MGRVLRAALILLLLFPAIASGQSRATSADLEGTVVDQSGGIIADAEVVVANVETNIARTVATDVEGRYRVPALPPGTYRVSASRPGFTTQVRENVLLSLGHVLTVDFTLPVGGVIGEVIVTAAISPLQRSRTEISSIIDQQQIDNLPTNGRNFISFSVLAPGVAPDHTPQQGATTTSGLSFAGQRARNNNIMVDGVDNNDLVVGAVRATFSQEAVREFQVLTDSYSAEFGKASGGVVNIVTKSGTNVFRGNAFYYFRDDSLNARSYFEQHDLFGNLIDLPKAPFNRNQWGGTLGGPVRKDETFFLTSFERTTAHDSRLVTIESSAANLLTSNGFSVQTGSAPADSDNTEVLGKIDHHWSATNSIAVRISYADIDYQGIDDFGGTVARSRGTVQHRKNWGLAAANTHVLSSRLLSEFRAQYADDDQSVNSLDPLCGEECITADQGGPTLELTGVASVGRQRFSPQLRHNRRLQFLETISYFRGNHQYKFGGEYNHLFIPNQELPLHFGGRYIFTAIPALGITSATDAFRRGFPAAYVQGYGDYINPENGYNDVSLFVQDEWRLNRLVIKPGIRYQRQYWEDFTYEVSDVGGARFSYPLPSDGNNIAPRLAAAYSLTNDDKTVLRASYGMFYDNIITTVPSVGRLINGAPNGVRTLVLTAPRAALAWSAAGHRLSEDQALALLGTTAYPSTVISLDPSLKTAFTHQTSVGVDRMLADDLTLSINGIYVRGFNMPGTIDYNPILPTVLGPNRRPNDLPCAAGTTNCVNGGQVGSSASVLQYTSFGESWYKGLTIGLNKRLSRRHQFLLSYTLSNAEETSADFQTNFIVQNNGLGRNPADKLGVPLGFDPLSERGPSLHDQRHRLVLSGLYQFPWGLQFAGIFTGASGRPFTPLAGVDLNGDGNGGSFPSDRARTNPADESTSVGRNSETTAAQYIVDIRVTKVLKVSSGAAIDLVFDAFNLFNRANFVEDTNQSSFVIFGTGSYPANPLSTYGKYTLTLPPRQIQLAARIGF
jgi:hypothetical protein